MFLPEEKESLTDDIIIGGTEKDILLSLGRFCRMMADRVIQIVGISPKTSGKSDGAVQDDAQHGDILVQLGVRGEKKIYAATLNQKGWWKDPFSSSHEQ